MLQSISAKKVNALLFSATGAKWRKSVADEEHLQIIRQGVDTWNAWSKKNPELIPDLRVADLTEANSPGLN